MLETTRRVVCTEILVIAKMVLLNLGMNYNYLHLNFVLKPKSLIIIVET
ncbi:hypothetical protein NIES3974_41430 [Calothrix sp. NIES-3974]|nr:hypothetical protein NIES3974_41430 [Calothrix sp. NIES-3974]